MSLLAEFLARIFSVVNLKPLNRMIETARTILKPLTIAEAEAIFAYRSLPEVYENQSIVLHDVKQAQDFVLKYSFSPVLQIGHWNQMGIFLKSDGRLIGDCGFCFFEDEQAPLDGNYPTGQAEIGYTISPVNQHNGYGHEAAKGIVDYLFVNRKPHRLVAKTDPLNEGSKRILQKLGFREEGYCQKSVKIRGEWRDEVIFSLLMEEWQKMQSNKLFNIHGKILNLNNSLPRSLKDTKVHKV